MPVELHPDILIVGSGIAGLSAAVPLAERYRVLVVTKGELFHCNTDIAQGGIAAAIREEDSPFLHFQDTMSAGDHLCREEAVRHLVEHGPLCVKELIDWGAQFDRTGESLAFGREGAHRMNRILHAHGDATGHEIMSTLVRKVKSAQNIEILEQLATLGLAVQDGTCRGALAVHRETGQVFHLHARGTILATGGAGRLYRRTTNSEQATGDGFAMAYQEGAVLEDMEFVQFHPTCLRRDGVEEFLLSEAMRGEGGLLRNVRGARFMPRYHPMADLAPRDVVSLAIIREQQATGADHVFLDMTHFKAAFLRKRFPGLYARCLAGGLDIARDPIPVSPAAHYFMGGVKVNLEGRTNLHGLFACGETACTGVHGANRLASNSLLEGLVFGKHTGLALLARPDLLAEPGGSAFNRPEWRHDEIPLTGTPDVNRLRQEFQALMWERVGILRSEESLFKAEETINATLRQLGSPSDLAGFELRLMLLAGLAVTRAARTRNSSWGGHFRVDHPGKDGLDDRHVNVVCAESNGAPATFWTH